MADLTRNKAAGSQPRHRITSDPTQDVETVDSAKQRDFAINVLQSLRDAGFETYWAGGCVRDHLLGFTPKDYDVATNATPPEVRRLFGRRDECVAQCSRRHLLVTQAIFALHLFFADH